MNMSNNSDLIVRPEQVRIGSGNSRRFEGIEHYSGISYFYVENLPGEGPGLHWHPYPETWVVLEGDVEFTVGDTVILGEAGDTATGPAYVPHSFVNAGESLLRILCIHASDTIVQTFIDNQSDPNQSGRGDR